MWCRHFVVIHLYRVRIATIKCNVRLQQCTIHNTQLQLPTPYSMLLAPYSLLPTPYSLIKHLIPQRITKYHFHRIHKFNILRLRTFWQWQMIVHPSTIKAFLHCFQPLSEVVIVAIICRPQHLR